MSIYFLSDFHLGEGDRQSDKHKYDLFCRFLEKTSDDMDHLVILGDMFDFWFEYHHLIPKRNLQILFKLHDMALKGIKISYVFGNHDFWMDDFLEKELGIEMVIDKLEITTPRGTILAMHGDGLAKSDWKYRLLKKVLRCKINIALYRLLPPAIAYRLAHWVASLSRHYTADRPKEKFLKQYFDYAQRLFQQGYFAFVCAHTHYPELKYVENNVYVNCGDWYRHFSYARFNDGKFELKSMLSESWESLSGE